MVMAAAGGAAAQNGAPSAALAVDPVTAIVEAFRTHQIVALGEGPHTNEQGHAFRLALIRDPRFAAAVNDIVVESGSARYQSVIDRFTRGDELPDNTLRDVLENSAGATPVWERPIYAEFFRAVRDVNRQLPREQHLRILLGDPPIDWDAVRSPADYSTWARRRDSHPAEVIAREVIARKRRALVIYGDGHLQARTERPARSLVGLIESAGTNVFNITSTFVDLATAQGDVATWRTPGLAMLRGTPIGAMGYERFFGPAPPVEYFRANPRIEDHFDAVLYLGPASSRTSSPLSYPRCAEPEYVQMRVARMMLAGSPPAVADRLTQECAAAQVASFEIASVRRNRSGQPGGIEDFIPAAGQVRVVNQTVRQMIRAAYGLEINRVVGGPNWIDSERFDVQARAASPVSREQLMSMARRLLAERFKLVARVEPRQQPIWALVPAAAGGAMGARLRPAASDCTQACGRISAGPGRMSGRSVSLDLLASMLAPRVGRLVVNQTGITELMDVDLEWGLDETQAAALAAITPLGGTPPTADPSRPGIFTALQEQLRLKLESTTGPVDVVVIDRVERPTED
jgi:uncharacterized protein (TIGR03435 family)